MHFSKLFVLILPHNIRNIKYFVHFLKFNLPRPLRQLLQSRPVTFSVCRTKKIPQRFFARESPLQNGYYFFNYLIIYFLICFYIFHCGNILFYICLNFSVPCKIQFLHKSNFTLKNLFILP